jgi:hypothetical protein
MDKVSEYLAARPEGATAEDIAREALGLTGAVGGVASSVIRAAAETDPRITEVDGGLWALRNATQSKRLRERAYVVIASREQPDGALGVGVTRVTFAGDLTTESFVIPRGRSESGVTEFNRLQGLVTNAEVGGFRFSTTRSSVNQISRLQVGRTCLSQGLCLSKLARRCYPDQKIRSCADVAEALGLSYVEPPDTTSASEQQATLLLGLLEQFEARDINTIEGVLEDLRPMVTAVDFEAFAFDETYLDDLPECPGVYVMRDVDGKVIYVGKSVHLRDRVKTYFAKRSEREEKTLKILDRIWTVEVQEVGSELEALMLEARLIQATQPEFNKQVEVHERGVSDRPPYVLVLPSADPESVELFCVRSDLEIGTVRTRKDLADWGEGWSSLNDYFSREAAELNDSDLAAHRILAGWLQQNGEKINLIDLGDAGATENLKGILEAHIRDADDAAWEKVWRI